MYNKQVCRMKGAKEMLEIIGDSRAVARAAIQLAMTATREEETELKASLTEKGYCRRGLGLRRHIRGFDDEDD